MAQGANLNLAVLGYAIGGHIAQVKALLAEGANLNCAVQGYAIGGHIAQVNALLAEGADPDFALMGYKEGGYTKDRETLLRVMSLTDDPLLKEALSETVPESESAALLKRAENLNQLMKKNHLSYSWARVYTPALNFLFLQGHLLIKQGNLNLDVFLKISSYLTGFSETDTYKFLSRHYEPGTRFLKIGSNTRFFKRQPSLVAEERNLLTTAELREEEKSLTLAKARLQALLYTEYPTKRQQFRPHGAFSQLFNLDGSKTISQLKKLLKNTAGDSIRLEAIREAINISGINTSKINFYDEDRKSGTDFVLTQIKNELTNAAIALGQRRSQCMA